MTQAAMKENLLTGSAIVLLLSTLTVPATTRYVSLDSPAPTPPYTDWSTAATNIQDAVNAADAGDVVLVTNGLYQTGGAMWAGSNRVVVTTPLILQSVNGPATTTIMGIKGNSEPGIPYVRCVLLTNGAALVGFTLTNGSAFNDVTAAGGGGVLRRARRLPVDNPHLGRIQLCADRQLRQLPGRRGVWGSA